MTVQESNDLRKLLAPASLDVDAAGKLLDSLAPDARLAAVRGMGKAVQAALFEAAAGRVVTFDFMVPRARGPLQEVIHEGKNTLPVFSHFQKRFCRSPQSDGELWGYNHQAMAPVTGPGYFVAYEHSPDFAIDYTRLPPSKPDAWPPILRNDQKLSRFIYNGTIDYLRRVSSHVTIGRATRGGVALDNWFLLCRQDD
jgi:hypothetical protein